MATPGGTKQVVENKLRGNDLSSFIIQGENVITKQQGDNLNILLTVIWRTHLAAILVFSFRYANISWIFFKKKKAAAAPDEDVLDIHEADNVVTEIDTICGGEEELSAFLPFPAPVFY